MPKNALVMAVMTKMIYYTLIIVGKLALGPKELLLVLLLVGKELGIKARLSC